MVKTQENADVPMLYSNMLNTPTAERKAAAWLTMTVVAALFLVLVELEEELVPVPDGELLRVPVVLVCLQMNFPWMTLPFPPDSAWKPEQSTAD